MSVRHMQGVSAQIETFKSNDGQKRHPAHCKHSEGKFHRRKSFLKVRN